MSRRIIWTEEKISKLSDEYPTRDINQLAADLGLTLKAVRSRAKVQGLHRDKSLYITTNAEYRAKIKELYPFTRNIDIATQLGISEGLVASIAFKMRLRKDPEFRAHWSSKGYFEKGHTPVNKGLKQIEYMSPDMIERTIATRFKSGNRSHNAVPVGSETDKTKGGYIKVKVAEPNIWKFKHRIIWEAENGPVPSGYNVQFKDGNRKNCDISNLYLISKHNQVNQNSIHRYPEDVKSAIRTTAVLKRMINKRLKNQKNNIENGK